MKRKLLALLVTMLVFISSTMTVLAESSSMAVSLGDGSGPGGSGDTEFEGYYIVIIPASININPDGLRRDFCGSTFRVQAAGNIPLNKEFYFSHPSTFTLMNSADNEITCTVTAESSKQVVTSEEMYNLGVALTETDGILGFMETVQLGAAVVELSSVINVPGHYEGQMVITYGIRNAS